MMLGVPLVTGAAAAPSFDPIWWSFFAAAWAVYLGRWPLMLLARQPAHPERARWIRWAAGYLLSALALGALLAARGRADLVAIGILAALLLAVHLWLVSRRVEMTVAGELWGVAGLTLAAPASWYAASGHWSPTAWGLYALNLAYFGATVFYVRVKVREQPKWPPDLAGPRRVLLGWKAWVPAASGVLVAVLWAPLLGWPRAAGLALLPGTIKAIAGAWMRPRRLVIARVGVVEVVLAALFGVLVALIA